MGLALGNPRSGDVDAITRGPHHQILLKLNPAGPANILNKKPGWIEFIAPSNTGRCSAVTARSSLQMESVP